jgi:hypothetical protein
MSLIRLGKTAISYQSQIDNFYVCGVVRSQSGYPFPRLVHSVRELDEYYGTDFDYYEMYKGLLQNEIPLLLIPILTSLSEYNKSSLRLIGRNIYDKDSFKPTEIEDKYYFPYCHPRIQKIYYNEGEPLYPSDQTIKLQKLYKRKYNFIQVLDFEKTTKFDHLDYFEVRIEDYDATQFNKGTNILVFFADQKGETLPLTPEYYSDGHTWGILRNSNYTVREYVRRLAALFKYTEEAQSWYADEPTKLFDYTPYIKASLLSEEIINFITKYESENPFDIDMANVDLDYFIDDYIDGLLSYTDVEEFSLIDQGNARSVVYDICNAIHNDIKPVYNEDGEILEFVDNYPGSGTSFLDRFTYYLDTLFKGSDNNYTFDNKIYLRFNVQTKMLRFYKVENFIVDNELNYDDDKLSELTERNKLLEFYCKYKGPQGSKIKIKITPMPFIKFKYQLEISNDYEQEYFYVDIATLNENLEYNSNWSIEEIKENYINIEDLGRYSNLVTCKLFNYILPNGQLCSQRDYETVREFYANKGEDPGEYDEFREIPVEYLDFPDDILETEFYLGRYINEYYEGNLYENQVRALESLKRSDFFPDLILEPYLNYGTNNVKYTKYLCELAKEKFTQILVRTDENHVDPSSNLQELYQDTESRILYFYRDLILDDNIFCSFYPYVINFINQEYLRAVSNKIIYKIQEYYHDGLDDTVKPVTEEILANLGINFIQFNNIFYYYSTLIEQKNEPNFILRFISSKISRNFNIASDVLINAEPADFSRQVSNVVGQTKAAIPLIDSISYTYERIENTYSIDLEVTVSKIVNKVFNINVTLNI